MTMRKGGAEWRERVGCDEDTQRTDLKEPRHGLGLRAGPRHLVHRNCAESVSLLRTSLTENRGC